MARKKQLKPGTRIRLTKRAAEETGWYGTGTVTHVHGNDDYDVVDFWVDGSDFPRGMALVSEVVVLSNQKPPKKKYKWAL